MTWWSRITHMFTVMNLRTHQAAISQRISHVEKQMKQQLSRLTQQHNDWRQKAERLERELQQLREQTMDKHAQYETEAEQLQNLLQELRERNRIAEQVTIPTLVAQHKLVLHRVEADIAAQLRRQVALHDKG